MTELNDRIKAIAEVVSKGAIENDTYVPSAEIQQQIYEAAGTTVDEIKAMQAKVSDILVGTALGFGQLACGVS